MIAYRWRRPECFTTPKILPVPNVRLTDIFNCHCFCGHNLALTMFFLTLISSCLERQIKRV